MTTSNQHCEIADAAPNQESVSIKSPSASWSSRYGQRHQLQRITMFPAGIIGPKRVRIYLRNDHYVLQWWDPGAKTNLADRVDGDLVAAITRAREIEVRLDDFKTSGRIRSSRVSPLKLVHDFEEDLRRRADASEISPPTVRRYVSALRLFSEFCNLTPIATKYTKATVIDRGFRLAFMAFLANRPSSLANSSCPDSQALTAHRFVLDAVRAMLEWAADPDRGGLLQEGFRNPFREILKGRTVERDPYGDPDITIDMGTAFISACDDYQIGLFLPIIFFGLRASAPCFLFIEHLADGWLRVPCLPEFDYATKGGREKRFQFYRKSRRI